MGRICESFIDGIPGIAGSGACGCSPGSCSSFESEDITAPCNKTPSVVHPLPNKCTHALIDAEK
eukprot:CAMPEP_0177525050 /NCGR_PEP_ID=MMETSP0369-20130122/50323_1 /TAXON_ID=447022 ORGANISM="Scrippsiella hangoei-like, Strain SHHI-4" /NCGR_SAMPLE_ID=MMETSP0369 /ASSEMBLY_ACC=CAM_ASM_000364 /LENGTH=63 /DNA_ID=CAMNT_0019005141 /DNA_START=43 /DNA_END=231 /DNA_ORIENTATION=+